MLHNHHKAVKGLATAIVLAVSTLSIIPASIIGASAAEATPESIAPYEQTAPTQLSLSNVTGAPGSTVAVNFQIANNTTGWEAGGFLFSYDEALSPVLNKKGNLQVTRHGEYTDFLCVSKIDLGLQLFSLGFSNSYKVEGDGDIATFYFQIPQSAAVGTVYDLGVTVDKISVKNRNGIDFYHILNEAIGGSITVVESEPEVVEQPSEVVINVLNTCGNVDDNPTIDPNDSIIILRATTEIMISGTCSLTPEQMNNGDVNHDGHIDADDAVLVLRYYASNLIQETSWESLMN